MAEKKKVAKAPAKKIAKPVAKPAVKPAAKVAAKPVAKAVAKPVTKAVAKPVAKVTAKPAAKSPAKKVESPVIPKKSSSNPAAKPESKPAVKAVAKAPAKPAAKAPAKPVAKTATKSATKAPAKIAEDLHSFTPEYLVLMQKDPNWMQAFWDVNQQRMAEAQEQGQKLVLRMYDVSKDLTVRSHKSRSFRDIEVPWDARSWYVQNTYAGTVEASLGFVESNGSDFEPLLESSKVYGMAQNGQTLQVSGDNGRFIRASLGGQGLGGSSELGLSSWSLGELTSSLTGSSEFVSSWAPLSSGVLSVPGMHWQGLGKDFFLWVKTRLIVYGGTRPDAHLQVRGLPFPLNPDGTFSLEMDLPDSTQVIPVFATDKDGDFPTTIVPIVVKRTE